MVELFDSASVVYLSPDATDILTDLEEDKVYVIGGLVDDSVKSQVTNFVLYIRVVPDTDLAGYPAK